MELNGPLNSVLLRKIVTVSRAPYGVSIRPRIKKIYTGCNRRNGPDFGRVFLRSYYTDITQNTYIQNSMVTEILAREV